MKAMIYLYKDSIVSHSENKPNGFEPTKRYFTTIGRRKPIMSGYRPHFKIGDLQSDCVITFDKEFVELEETNELVDILILFPDQFHLEKNNEFELYEGRKLVGKGIICLE